MVFRDAAHFHQIEEEAIADYTDENGEAPAPIFFCDPAAFGQYNHKRNINLVDKYWTNLAKFGWEKQFTADRTQIPFLEAWGYLKDPKHFPIMGPLAGYLLTADFSYCGAVKEPTIDDIAYVIWYMNKGAAAALEELRLIPRRKVSAKGTISKANHQDVLKAVRALYERLKVLLPQDLQTRVGFGPIVLEHSLCKFSRSIKKDWFRLNPMHQRKVQRKQ